MSKILVPSRRIWTRQPQQPVEIDWSNPITRGLAIAVEPDLIDLARRRRGATVVGSGKKVSTSYGVAQSLSSTVINYGTDNPLSGREFTFQLLEIPTSLTQAAGIVDKRETAAANNSFSIGYNYTAGSEFSVDFGNSTGAGGTSGVAYSFSRSQFSTDGNHLVITANLAASSLEKIKLWRNNASISLERAPTADNLVSEIYAGTSPLEIGRVNNGTLYYAGKLVFFRAWSRQLISDEIRSLFEAPYQIFKPRRRVAYFDIVAGGLTSVYSDNAVAYAIREMLSSDTGIEYAIRNAIYKDDAVGYYLRSAIAQNSEVGYVLRSAIAKDDAEAYKIRGLVQASDAEAYSIRGLVQASDGEAYKIRSQVQADTSTSYDIQSSTSVASSNAVNYSVRGAVAASVLVGYSVRGSAQRDAASAYSVRSAVSRDVVASYSVSASASSVYADSTASYLVDGVVPSDPSAESIAAAVLAALQATTIPVNIKQVNDVTVQGAGTKLNPWQPV